MDPVLAFFKACSAGESLLHIALLEIGAAYKMNMVLHLMRSVEFLYIAKRKSGRSVMPILNWCILQLRIMNAMAASAFAANSRGAFAKNEPSNHGFPMQHARTSSTPSSKNVSRAGASEKELTSGIS